MTYCTTGASFNYENGLCCYLQTTTATVAAFSLVSGEHGTLPGIERVFLYTLPPSDFTREQYQAKSGQPQGL